MDFIDGAVYGAAGSAVYQLVEVYFYRRDMKKWPWNHKKVGMTLPSFCFGVVVKLIAAFGLVGLMADTEQISGAWAAAGAGMVADHIVMNIAQGLRKEYTR